MEFQALLKQFTLPFGLLLLFLCSPQSCSSQELSCNQSYSFITQPPQSIPCNPYPTSNTTSSTSLQLECTVSVPVTQASTSKVVWFRRQGKENRKELVNGGVNGSVHITVSRIVNVPSLTAFGIRSVLKLSGLKNNLDYVGVYYCQIGIGEDAVILSNRSRLTDLLEPASYSEVTQCESGIVFLQLSPQCAEFPTEESTTISTPDTDINTNEPTNVADPEDQDSVILTLDMVIILGSVGGVMVLLVVLLLVILFITCCCVRRLRKTAPGMIKKDKSLPYSASMSSIHQVIENGNPTTVASINAPSSLPPVPSHPPPLHSTLPTKLKQSVTEVDSTEVDSLSDKTGRRAATLIGKLKVASIPVNENGRQSNNDALNAASSIQSVDRGEQLYKSLITDNMDNEQEYVITNPLLKNTDTHHSSAGPMAIVSDEQPVYSEPTMSTSLSSSSISKMPDTHHSSATSITNEQPVYSEPTMSTSLSSASLSKIALLGSSKTELPNKSRPGFTLPLGQTPPGTAVTSEQDQPIYSMPDDPNTPQKTVTPTGRGKKPVVPRRPVDKPRKKHVSTTDDRHITGNKERESIDGEYVCPNAPINGIEQLGKRGQKLKVGMNQPREVVLLRNGEIAPPPHQYQGLAQGNQEYLTLYMTPDNN